MITVQKERLHYTFVSFLQGFDPPHQSDTRTIYIANRFPQHGHYVPQKFADNRIISSKVTEPKLTGMAALWSIPDKNTRMELPFAESAHQQCSL